MKTLQKSTWKEKLKTVFSKPFRDNWGARFPFLLLAGLSAVLTITIEVLSRRSLGEGLAFIGESPAMFAVNCLIVLTTLSLSLLTTRRNFVALLISLAWLFLGIVNCVLLSFRVTPLTAIDFAILKSVITIIRVYLSPGEIAGVLTAFVLVGLGVLIAWKKLPRCKISLRHIPLAAVLVVVFVGGSVMTTNAAAPESFVNISKAYDDYGFAYCFTTSVIDRGIDEPDNYSEEAVQDVLEDLEEDTEPQIEEAPEKEPVSEPVQESPAEMPNIVMVQLESFFDVHRLKGAEFSENPIPVFTALQNELGSSFLVVPTIGAGTVNTEFEILTGMSLDFFGAGEYPYKTVLQDQTCESICYNLKELGYSAHAIHNHEGTFYDRDLVFANLGFDTFTPAEYMVNLERNEIGWAKDKVLTEEIFNAMNSTDGQDFVYAISVQPHGKYPDEMITEQGNIDVMGWEELEEAEKEEAFEYYLSQIHETDAFIGELTAALEACEEPALLVIYGDHLPNIGLSDEDLIDGNCLQTEYIIWNNFGLETETKDLSAYQLTAYIQELLDMNQGVLTRFHQTAAEDPGYQEELQLLQYDMLYGDKEVYGGQNPFPTTELKMGTK